jgi:hypothetical protein
MMGEVPEPITAELLAGLDVALNEAELHDVVVRSDRREAAVLVEVLTLPDIGPEQLDRRILVRLTGVGRVVASLRHGRWDDPRAPVESFDLDSLSDVVSGFGLSHLYGWEFFDAPASRLEGWRDRVSLDVRFDDRSGAHSLYLFKEPKSGPARHLDLVIFFDGLGGYDARWHPVSLEEVVAGARRWWDALRRGDQRAEGHGIVSGKGSTPRPPLRPHLDPDGERKRCTCDRAPIFAEALPNIRRRRRPRRPRPRTTGGPLRGTTQC